MQFTDIALVFSKTSFERGGTFGVFIFYYFTLQYLHFLHTCGILPVVPKRVIYAGGRPIGPAFSILLTGRILPFFWPKLWDFVFFVFCSWYCERKKILDVFDRRASSGIIPGAIGSMLAYSRLELL